MYMCMHVFITQTMDAIPNPNEEMYTHIQSCIQVQDLAIGVSRILIRFAVLEDVLKVRMHASVHTSVCMCVCVCIYIYIYMRLDTVAVLEDVLKVRMHASVHTRVCVCVCVCVCVYIYIYIYIYIYAS